MKNRILWPLALLVSLGLTGCGVSEFQRARLKSELKREILAELKWEQPSPAPPAASPGELARMREEIEKNLMAKLESRYSAPTAAGRPHPQGILRSPVPVGNLEGRILHGGKALTGCRVKVVRMMRSYYMRDIFRAMNQGTEFVAVTNETGRYRFLEIPIGDYKLKWQPAGEQGWIRRLRDKPDVTVTPGGTALAKSVETNRRLVPH